MSLFETKCLSVQGLQKFLYKAISGWAPERPQSLDNIRNVQGAVMIATYLTLDWAKHEIRPLRLGQVRWARGERRDLCKGGPPKRIRYWFP
jgi:hypothetical protein